MLTYWYSILFVAVRWNDYFSKWFKVSCGVRQGGILSPSAFNTFFNLLIVNLRLKNVGCTIGNNYLGCVLYADDIILFSASVNGLQQMLDSCFDTCTNLSLEFNCSKSNCIVFGPASRFKLTPMKLGSKLIDWVSSIKYLGINICGGKTCKCDIDPILRSFYCASNCIFSHCANTDQLLQLHLQESYSLSILTYASAVISFTKVQLDRMNAGWNTIYRHIFGFNKWDSVKVFINGLGFLDFKHIVMLRKAKFFRKLRLSKNAFLLDILHSHVAMSSSDIIDRKLQFHTRIFDINAFVYNDFAEICAIN